MSSFFSKSYVWTFDSLTCLFFTGSLRLIFKVLLFFYYLSFKIILFGFREKKIRLRKQACYSLNLCLNFDPLSLKTNIFRLGVITGSSFLCIESLTHPLAPPQDKHTSMCFLSQNFNTFIPSSQHPLHFS